ncbi:MAG: glycosyltransferase [Bacillota bacterium]
MDQTNHGQFLKYSVSIIIPVFNQVKYTKKCINSLLSTLSKTNAEIIIVDNGSSDETGLYLKTLPQNFRIITNNKNLGFSKACNIGAKAARGKYLVFLNNDTVALPSWLEEMLNIIEGEENVGVVGSRLLFPDGTIQHAGVLIACNKVDPLFAVHAFYRVPGHLPEANEFREYQAVTGACLLIKKDLFFEVNGFNEVYINGYEDIDLCFKIKHKGYRVVYCPKSVLYHHESVSQGRHDHFMHNRSTLHKLWLGRIKPDARYEKGRLSDYRASVSIVLATQNSINTIRNCLNALLPTLDSYDELIIVDDNSTDGTGEYLKGLKKRMPAAAIILSRDDIGLSAAYSLGVSRSSKEYVSVLSPEAVVTKSWLTALKYFDCPGIGAVGPLTNKKTERQWFQNYISHGDLPEKVTAGELEAALQRKNSGKAVETQLLDGLCMIIPKKVIDELGMFETEDLLEKYDLELSWRLTKKGYKLLIATDTFVFCE